ncbi:NAD(P)H-dependent oxidoreductase [Gallaecimonas kandeliae]|uniref:FMN-dependent NADH-azoreductase n=1 Tax=Gallaecimonas kandeliae TaxID=3029055 RepID=UPI002648F497|nr:NAD(P)H-dependent oxidoreductase [Gallaecimonas kandeliae]WKE66500.1 NAD(P)H-dependent oxidoreductase [Gallaecimonas kandeliae]
MSKLNILRIDASMRVKGSTGRQLSDQLIDRLGQGQQLKVVNRDLSQGISFISDAWIEANFTDKAERSPQQQGVLAQSDALVGEVRDADVLVLAVPIYNFGVPAAFKAWVDQIARARETFRFTERGPEGLLTGKKAYVIVTSGGTPMFSDIDFASGFVRHVLGFIGITDVTFIGADKQLMDAEALAKAEAQIAAIAA